MKYFNILTKKIKNIVFMLILHCYIDATYRCAFPFGFCWAQQRVGEKWRV